MSKVPTRLSEEEKARIVELRKRCLSHNAIARIIGRSSIAVSDALQTHDNSFAKAPPPPCEMFVERVIELHGFGTFERPVKSSGRLPLTARDIAKSLPWLGYSI